MTDKDKSSETWILFGELSSAERLIHDATAHKWPIPPYVQDKLDKIYGQMRELCEDVRKWGLTLDKD